MYWVREKKLMKSLNKYLKLSVLAPLALSVATSCGKQQYQVGYSTETQAAAQQTFQIPAKVDILLAEDDMASMYEVYQQVDSQFPQFLNTLDQQGWDYHFTVMPLST